MNRKKRNPVAMYGLPQGFVPKRNMSGRLLDIPVKHSPTSNPRALVVEAAEGVSQ